MPLRQRSRNASVSNHVDGHPGPRFYLIDFWAIVHWLSAHVDTIVKIRHGVNYQKIAPAVKKLYESGSQSTTQIMSYFGIGSRRTFYKVLRYAGVDVKSLASGRKADQKPLA